MPDERVYLTTEEVAELLRTSPETVRYWRSRGDGPPSFRLGRRVLYHRDELDRWIAEQRARGRDSEHRDDAG